MTDELFSAAKTAMQRAYARYSNFKVGAAIRSSNGNIYAGCNVENASYSVVLCAESGAIAQMIAAGDQCIDEIAIISENPKFTSPCGACRQRIAEFSNQNTPIKLYNLNAELSQHTLGELLPLSFNNQCMENARDASGSSSV